jgi:hypothetical protein
MEALQFTMLPASIDYTGICKHNFHKHRVMNMDEMRPASLLPLDIMLEDEEVQFYDCLSFLILSVLRFTEL